MTSDVMLAVLKRFIRKMLFELEAVNYYHKALHLECCSSPRSASEKILLFLDNAACRSESKEDLINKNHLSN